MDAYQNIPGEDEEQTNKKDIKKHIHRYTDIQMMKKKKEEEKEYEIIRDWIVEVAYLQI